MVYSALFIAVISTSEKYSSSRVSVYKLSFSLDSQVASAPTLSYLSSISPFLLIGCEAAIPQAVLLGSAENPQDLWVVWQDLW